MIAATLCTRRVSMHLRSKGPRSGGGRGDQKIFPKPTRLDLPRFNGNADPLGWITHCEQLFCHHNTPDSDFLGIVSFRLDGDDQLWFLKLTADCPNLTWEDFKQCQTHFGRPLSCNHLGALSKLRQSGTIGEYQRRFENLLARVDPLTNKQEIQLYLGGLRDYIAMGVFSPPTSHFDQCHVPCPTV